MIDTLTILDFHIKPRSSGRYAVEIYRRDSSELLAAAEFDYDLSYMTEFRINQLDYGVGDPVERLGRLTEFGQSLYKKLFSPEIERVWCELNESNSFLVLCLRIDPQAVGLEALPWETLFDGEEFIAAGAMTGLSRLPLDIAPPPDLPAVAPPLKMLALVSSPLDLGDGHRLQIEREQEILLQAVNAPAGQGRLQLDLEDEAKLDILESSLDSGQGGYQIFHFTGHGYFSPEESGLLLEDAEGKALEVSTAEILRSLRKGGGALRLAVISGCQTARTRHVAGFRDLARGLAHQNVPAVVAMQFSISDPGAIRFAEVFYPKLVDGHPLEPTMSAARRALLHGNDPEWRADALAPVLITSNGNCLRAAETQAPGPKIQPAIDFSFHLPLAQLDFGFYGRRREYRRIRDGLINQNHRAVIIHGIGGIGKTALISSAASRLRRRFRGVYAFDCSSGTLAPERILLDLHRYFERQGIKALEPLIHQFHAAGGAGELPGSSPDSMAGAADPRQFRDSS
ncbi:MAG TPA: CHAT domain-containing protein [Blastocatellia bacterium]|nr:CHAT domain-containing protein [Blastocatellia bacterium]